MNSLCIHEHCARSIIALICVAHPSVPVVDVHMALDAGLIKAYASSEHKASEPAMQCAIIGPCFRGSDTTD